ncbi:hypothetical protein BDN67DRAFT_972085, partial [Paxillus ammoniavirescens]
RTGQVSAPPAANGRSRTLNAMDVSATLSCTLKRSGFTRKKLTRPAIERNEARRAAYKLHMGQSYEPHQLVFVDESHLNCLTTWRPSGWTCMGRCARRRDFFIHGQR